MIESFLPLLEQNGVIILDGALATELERHGADLNDSLWSAKVLMENPALIRKVHLDYLQAGANVISSASYQATFRGFARRGISHAQAANLLRLSVQLAIDARAVYGISDIPHSALRTPHSILVAASVGPYGAFLADGSEYRGDYGLTVAQLMGFHRARMAVLVESGADLLACETIPCWQEGKALLELLKEFPAARAWLSFSCKDGEHCWHGEPFADCVALANESAQIIAVGVNCSAPEYIESLVRVAKDATAKPIVVYPNRGEGYDPVQHCWLPGKAAFSPVETAKRAYAAGARLIGGCCRTTPEDILEMAGVLKG